MIQEFEQYLSIDRALLKDWQEYHENHTLSGGAISSSIENAWKRCESLKVKSNTASAPNIASNSELDSLLEMNRLILKSSIPHMDVLFQELKNLDPYVILADNEGTILKLLHTKGRNLIPEKVNILPGASWTEENCGNNGIGSVIKENNTVSVFGYEHYCSGFHEWICTGMPIRDPLIGKQLGVVNISGNKKLVSLHNRALVQSIGRLIEVSLYEHLFFSEESSYFQLLNSEKPVIAFDEYFKITHVNVPAVRELGLISGDSFQIFPPEMSLPTFLPIKNKYKDEKGREWMVSTSPYIISGRILGRIAVFDKINNAALPGSFSINKKSNGVSEIVTQNAEMERLKLQAIQMGSNDYPVLIVGETGTGKELFAKVIHDYSKRNKKPFVIVNCGAIPKDLIASELFGYVKGAFTNANPSGKKGMFEVANGGTLFLDEIGELPLDMQTYLLRVLEDNTVYRLGSTEGIPVNVRIVAATNKELKDNVKFRSDLLYRINVMTLSIPPLRERKGDVMLLFSHFIKNHEAHYISVKNEVFNLLKSYDWPGNVRELKNTCLSAIFNTEFRKDSIITLEDLPKSIKGKKEIIERSTNYSNVQAAIKKTGGNKSKAAELLGISRMTLYRMIHEVKV